MSVPIAPSDDPRSIPTVMETPEADQVDGSDRPEGKPKEVRALPPTIVQSSHVSPSQGADTPQATSAETDLPPTVQSTSLDPARSARKRKSRDSLQRLTPEPAAERPPDRGAPTARPNLEATIVQEGGALPSSQADRRGVETRSSANLRFGSSVSPMTTLTGRDVEEVHEEGLIIRKRRLRSRDATDVDEADYQVVRQIGKGGMGRVHLAVQTALNRRVAVKELNPKTSRDPQNRRKFLSEAAITGELDHQHRPDSRCGCEQRWPALLLDEDDLGPRVARTDERNFIGRQH